VKRKAVLLVVGCSFLTLAYLAIHSSLSPRYFAQGAILLNLQLVAPTNDPAMSNWNWYVGQQASSKWNSDYDSRPAISEWNWFFSQPAVSNWYCHVRHPSIISNLVNERITTLIRDSAALDDNIRLVAVYPVRSTSLIVVRFSGSEESAVWRVASNSCVMLTRFYASNLPFELQTTNQVTREVEHLDTSFWTPDPLWHRMRDYIEDLFRR